MSNNPIEGPAEALSPDVPHEPPAIPSSSSVDTAASAETPLPPTPPLVEDPPWTGVDVFILAAITIFSISLTVLGVSLFVHSYFAPQVPWLDLARKPEVLVLSQVLGYLIVLGLMYRLAATRGGSAAAALQWNWPTSWPAFLGYGVVLSISLQLLAHVLPMPKTLPIDEFFQTAGEAWMLSIFSITFAPLLEELFFRGFLYPLLRD